MWPNVKDLLPLGVGGTILIVVLKLVFDYLKQTKFSNGNGKPAYTNGQAGNQSKEYWQLEYRKAIAEVLSQSVIPLFEQNSKMLEKLTGIQEDIRREIREGNLKSYEAQVNASAALTAVISEIRLSRARAAGSTI